VHSHPTSSWPAWPDPNGWPLVGPFEPASSSLRQQMAAIYVHHFDTDPTASRDQRWRMARSLCLPHVCDHAGLAIPEEN
jgi:hypothetical protein